MSCELYNFSFSNKEILFNLITYMYNDAIKIC